MLAYHLARKSNWIQIVADRHRFQQRIQRTATNLIPILTAEHRDNIFYNRYKFKDGYNQNKHL